MVRKPTQQENVMGVTGTRGHEGRGSEVQSRRRGRKMRRSAKIHSDYVEAWCAVRYYESEMRRDSKEDGTDDGSAQEEEVARSEK